MANQVTLPTPPSALPPKITNVASAILHYDIIVAGAVTGSMAILGSIVPHGAEYAQWVLYALAVIAGVMKLAGATASTLSAMLGVVLVSVGALWIVRCTPAQQASDDAVADCLVSHYDASDAGTVGAKLVEAAYDCRYDEAAAIALLKARAPVIFVDAGTDH